MSCWAPVLEGLTRTSQGCLAAAPAARYEQLLRGDFVRAEALNVRSALAFGEHVTGQVLQDDSHAGAARWSSLWEWG